MGNAHESDRRQQRKTKSLHHSPQNPAPADSRDVDARFQESETDFKIRARGKTGGILADLRKRRKGRPAGSGQKRYIRMRLTGVRSIRATPRGPMEDLRTTVDFALSPVTCDSCNSSRSRWRPRNFAFV
jgi:hypothetical protein